MRFLFNFNFLLGALLASLAMFLLTREHPQLPVEPSLDRLKDKIVRAVPLVELAKQTFDELVDSTPAESVQAQQPPSEEPSLPSAPSNFEQASSGAASGTEGDFARKPSDGDSAPAPPGLALEYTDEDLVRFLERFDGCVVLYDEDHESLVGRLDPSTGRLESIQNTGRYSPQVIVLGRTPSWARAASESLGERRVRPLLLLSKELAAVLEQTQRQACLVEQRAFEDVREFRVDLRPLSQNPFFVTRIA